MLQVDEFSNVSLKWQKTHLQVPYIHFPRGVTCNWRGQDPAACEVCEPFLIEIADLDLYFLVNISEGEDWT